MSQDKRPHEQGEEPVEQDDGKQREAKKRKVKAQRSMLTQSLSHMPQFEEPSSLPLDDEEPIEGETHFAIKRHRDASSLTLFSVQSPPIRKRNKTPQPSALKFFKDVYSHFTHRKSKTPIAFIIVTHTLPTIPDFLDGLDDIPNCRIGGLILKSSIRDKKTFKKLKQKGVKLLNYEGEDFSTEVLNKEKLRHDPQIALRVIEENINEGEKAIIIDTGGYFANFIKHGLHTEKLLGIVEDTENGHQKYEKVQKYSKYPILSVARGELKKGEDYNVGKAIKQATDTLLRSALDERLENHEVAGVIGFGKIGSAIVEHLDTIRVVMVHDRNALVAFQAASRDVKVVEKEELLEKASLIFCATGNKCLSKKDFINFGHDRVILSSCTSADDELDLTGLGEPHYKCEEYTEYHIKTGPAEDDYVTVILLVGGNAVNFYYKAIVGHAIRGVQAALLVCASRLMFEEFPNTQTIHTLEYKQEYSIAQLFLQEFNRMQTGVEHNLPTRNQDFVGRTEPMKAIFRQLYGKSYDSFKTSNSRVLIWGESGLGKTQTALEFAWRNLEYYSFVWWIDAEHGIAQAIYDLAKRLNIESYGKTYSEIAKEIPYKLRTEPDFLLIFDNVNDLDPFSELFDALGSLGNGRRHMICLSNKNLPEFEPEYKVEIRKFSEQSSNRYFRKKMRKRHKEKSLVNCSQLNTQLDHHPLYLEKATAFIRNKKLSPEEYLKQLAALKEDNVFSAIIKLTTTYLSSINKDIIRAVIICSFLYGDRIPEKLIHKMLSSVMDDTLILTAINTMLEYEIFKVVEDQPGVKPSSPREGKRYFYMHKLTQNVIRQQFIENNPSAAREYCYMAVHTMSKYFQYEYYGQRTKKQLSLYIAHIHAVIDTVMRLAQAEFNDPCYDLTMRLTSFYLNEYRNYQASHDCAQKALQIKPDDAKAMHMVAINMLYMKPEGPTLEKSLDQSNLQRIEELAKSAHHAFSVSTEPHHQLYLAETLITFSYVFKYRCKCANSDAEKIELISQAEEKLKEASLTLVQYSQGDKTKALSRVQALLYHARGDIHFIQGGLLASKDITAANEKYTSAAKDFVSAIKKRTEVLGSAHVDLARSQYKYSLALAALGQLEQAEEYCLKAVELQKRAFIAPHPNLTDSLKELSKIRMQKAKSSNETIPPSPSTMQFEFN